MTFSIVGFICWGFGILIWTGGKSAIHEILAAIVILNGTVMVAAAHVAYSVDQISAKTDHRPTTTEEKFAQTLPSQKSRSVSPNRIFND